ncbi:unnamed protein product [Oikopleura dioica]|uniref:Uncharacterized protein n=1 Tax=Oikopleura dioica TaxID=34765 RepID=E4WZA6_OIKDI|nr:unnamed protein product [Oikopleura dioica]
MPTRLDGRPDAEKLTRIVRHYSPTEKHAITEYFLAFRDYFHTVNDVYEWLEGAPLRENLVAARSAGLSDSDSQQWIQTWINCHESILVGLEPTKTEEDKPTSDNLAELLLSGVVSRKPGQGRGEILDARLLKIASRLLLANYVVCGSIMLLDVMIETRLVDYSGALAAMWASSSLKVRLEDSIVVRPLALHILLSLVKLNLVEKATDLRHPLCRDSIDVLGLLTCQPSRFEAARVRETVESCLKDPLLHQLQAALLSIPTDGVQRVSRILGLSQVELEQASLITEKVIGVDISEFIAEFTFALIQQSCTDCGGHMLPQMAVSEETLFSVIVLANEWLRRALRRILEVNRRSPVTSFAVLSSSMYKGGAGLSLPHRNCLARSSYFVIGSKCFGSRLEWVINASKAANLSAASALCEKVVFSTLHASISSIVLDFCFRRIILDTQLCGEHDFHKEVCAAWRLKGSLTRVEYSLLSSRWRASFMSLRAAPPRVVIEIDAAPTAAFSQLVFNPFALCFLDNTNESVNEAVNLFLVAEKVPIDSSIKSRTPARLLNIFKTTLFSAHPPTDWNTLMCKPSPIVKVEQLMKYICSSNLVGGEPPKNQEALPELSSLYD